MSVEGRVLIDVTLGAAPVVRISFTQAGDVARVLAGKTPGEVRAIVPALFSLCGKAQSHAAHLALDAAQGRKCASEIRAAMQCLTEMESLRENTLRIALDWPRLLGERADRGRLPPLMRLVPELESALQSRGGPLDAGLARSLAGDRALRVVDAAETLVADLVFGEPIERWQEREDANDVRNWAAAGRTPAARLLHRIYSQGMAEAGSVQLHRLAPLDGHSVLNWFEAGGMHALPLDRGSMAPETTMLARHATDRRLAGATNANGCNANDKAVHGLMDRLTARLIELAGLPSRMRELIRGRVAPYAGRRLAEAVGMGEVAAARGTLMHVASMEDGRISRYRVLAPTRWNFDVDGVAGRAVERIASEYGEDAQILAELMVDAIDPCVAYSVRIH
ncbi:MAG: nickel-dependent hydrogenase large subunit [Hyphomicrobiaceae bacterium]|nr:nickel-dependent hydrogenase large subunit [Hyphomicrobiaceae bacterium]